MNHFQHPFWEIIFIVYIQGTANHCLEESNPFSIYYASFMSFDQWDANSNAVEIHIWLKFDYSKFLLQQQHLITDCC